MLTLASSSKHHGVWIHPHKAVLFKCYHQHVEPKLWQKQNHICFIYCCNYTLVSPAVDGDPHFMIELPDRDDALCFNINDKPGTIFNLVRDPTSGQPWLSSRLSYCLTSVRCGSWCPFPPYLCCLFYSKCVIFVDQNLLMLFSLLVVEHCLWVYWDTLLDCETET